MAQQNGRLNTDLDNKLTSSYYDGAKWHMFIKALNADIEALGSTTDPATAQTVIGLLKALIAKLPSALQNDALKSVLTAPIPAGTNKIGSVDIANSPTVRVDSATAVNVNMAGALPAGSNKIGSVDIANNPTVRVDSATPVNVNVTNTTPMSVNIANSPTVQIDDSTPINVSLNGASGGVLDVNVTNQNPLQVTVAPNSLVFTQQAPPLSIEKIEKTASEAGTPESVFGEIPPYWLVSEYIVVADKNNTGSVYIGGATMDGTDGIELTPGERFRLNYGGPLFFSAENAGDKIKVFMIFSFIMLDM
ncbi:hypothetical protein ACPVTF_04190 [Geobacillus icigianus]|uniref:Uncharacterized protein n=1 Tax=Geobacillus subterraneus TaxID=129338 RepID=A0A679FMJ6_9BACL|nr:hypothetical protein [Geobacillus subterraneus]BBW97220.1 hypothetical protein GsuE55_20530 [Geobacillus subterraneus]